MTIRKLVPGQAGLPVPSPSDSYWLRQPEPALLGHHTTEELPKEVDVVVVGSGITGAFAARFLLEGQNEVLLLEAREACWGATGRVRFLLSLSLSMLLLFRYSRGGFQFSGSLGHLPSLFRICFSQVASTTTGWLFLSSPYLLPPPLNRDAFHSLVEAPSMLTSYRTAATANRLSLPVRTT